MGVQSWTPFVNLLAEYGAIHKLNFTPKKSPKSWVKKKTTYRTNKQTNEHGRRRRRRRYRPIKRTTYRTWRRIAQLKDNLPNMEENRPVKRQLTEHGGITDDLFGVVFFFFLFFILFFFFFGRRLYPFLWLANFLFLIRFFFKNYLFSIYDSLSQLIIIQGNFCM